MASVKFSVGIADIRGKVGGTVFQRNKSGAFIRTLRKPTKSTSSWSLLQRTNVAYYSRAWRSLSTSDQDLWNSVAIQFPQTNRIGDTIFLSGYQLFQKVNQNLEVAGYF